LNQAGRLSAAKSRRPLAGFKFILSLSKDPAPAHPGRDFTSNFIDISVFNWRTINIKGL
jgi:hypothetical protein